MKHFNQLRPHLHRLVLLVAVVIGCAISSTALADGLQRKRVKSLAGNSEEGLKFYGTGELTQSYVKEGLDKYAAFVIDQDFWWDNYYELNTIYIDNGITSVQGNAFSYYGAPYLNPTEEMYGLMWNLQFKVNESDEPLYLGENALNAVKELYIYRPLAMSDGATNAVTEWSAASCKENTNSDIRRVDFYGNSTITSGMFSNKKVENLNFHNNNLASWGEQNNSSFGIVQQITFGEEVEEIPDYFWKNSTRSTTVTIENPKCRYMPDLAFYGCDNMTLPDYTLQNWLYYYGLDYDFNGIVNEDVETVFIPNDEVSTHDWTRTINTSWTSEYNLSTRFPNLKKVIFGKNVTTVGDCLCYGCTKLESVEFLGNNVTEIGDHAFSGCTSLTSINIPYGVTTIGGQAFFKCENLEAFIPQTVTSLGASSFWICSKVTIDSNSILNPETPFDNYSNLCGPFYGVAHIVIGPNVTSIGDYAFYHDTSLESLYIGENVKTIGAYAFWQNNKLSSMNLNNVVRIGTNAFYHCNGLELVEIPSTVTTLGSQAFCFCYNAVVTIRSQAILNPTTPYTASNNLGSNGNMALRGVKQILFGGDVKIIGDYAFYKDADLTAISFGPSVKIIGKLAFCGCTGLTWIKTNQLIFPSASSFVDCTNLTDVTIMNNELASNELYNANENLAGIFQSVQKLTFTSDVQEVARYAFYGSPTLRWVNFENKNTIYYTTSFSNCPKLQQLLSFQETTSDGLQLTYETDTKTLTINYTAGANGSYYTMPNYTLYTTSASNNAPWKDLIDDVENLVLTGSINNIGRGAFCNFTKLKTITFDDNKMLTTIGEGAFYGCTSLESLNIPYYITTIGSKAFQGCTALKEITTGRTSRCATIGAQAFDGCTGIETVVFYPTSLTVGSNAFDSAIKSSAKLYVTNTTSHPLKTYFDNVQNLATTLYCGENVNWSVSSDGTLTVSNSNTNVYYRTYDYDSADATPWADVASSITKVVVTGRIYCIGKYLFSGLTNLTSVDLTGVTDLHEIRDCAFRDCEKLTSISIPSTVTTIGQFAFAGCSKLTSVTLPENIKYIAYAQFQNCTSLESITLPSGLTTIKQNAFSGCSKLSSINLPDGLGKIGPYAFDGCSALTHIDLPEAYTVIDEEAFYGSGLTSLTLSSDITEIGEGAFGNCTALTSVTTYGDSKLAKIGNFAFSSDEQLATFMMPGRVREIGEGAFKYCSLSKVSFSNDLEVLGDDAFYGNKLTEVEIPSSITSLGSVFTECASLTKVTLPNTLESLKRTFSGCSALESIDLPEHLTSLGNGTFSYCTKLSDITLPDELTYLGEEVFKECTSLKEIVIPEGITAINHSAFYNSGLTSITLPESIDSIRAYAFYGCHMINFTLPKNVTYIGEYAFSNSSLYNFYAQPLTPPVVADINAFEGHDAGLTILTANEAYQSAAVWSELKIDNPYKNDCGGYNMYYEISGTGDDGYVLKLNCYDSSAEKTELPDYDILSPAGGPWLSQWADIVPDIVSVEICSELTRIGNYTFSGLTGLKSITIPATVTSIGKGAFAGCTSLEEIYVKNLDVAVDEEGIADDDVYANALVYSTDPDALKEETAWAMFTNILPYAAGYCGKALAASGYQNGEMLSYVVHGHDLYIESNLSGSDFTNLEIGGAEMADYSESAPAPWAQYGEYITSISWGYTGYLQNIGAYAFSGITNLPTFEIPETVTSIGDYAFAASNLQYLEIPETVNEIGEGAFANDTLLTELTLPANLTAIAASTFEGSAIEEIAILSDVTTIGSAAFKDCSNLTKVTLPKTLTEIGNNAFSGCTALASLELPASLTTISAEAFSSTALTTLTIPDAVTSIGEDVFADCSDLQEIYVNSSIRSNTSSYLAGETTNDVYTNATVYTDLPQSLSTNTYWKKFTNILPHVTGYCGKVDTESDDEILLNGTSYTYTIHGNNLHIDCNLPYELWDTYGEMADYESYTQNPWYRNYRAYITNITWGDVDGLTYIGNYAFSGLANLTSIEIPESVTSTGKCVFDVCSKLSDVSLPSGLTVISEHLFDGCTSLTSIDLPDATTKISNYAFKSSGLESITFPGTVTNIGVQCFYGCTSLKSITLPASCSTIGIGAFQGCTALETVTNYSTTPQTISESKQFNNVTLSNVSLYVPEASIDTYAAATVWKDFGNIYAIGTVNLTDGVAYTNTEEQECTKITYTRKFSTHNLQALYVPFDIEFDELDAAGLEVAYLVAILQDDVNNNGVIDDNETELDYIWVKEGSTIHANTPYFVRLKDSEATGTKTITALSRTLYPAEENNICCATTMQNFTFQGTYNTVYASTLTQPGYYVVSGGSLKHLSSGSTSSLSPYRWYLTITDKETGAMIDYNAASEIRLRNVDSEEDMNGISTIYSDTNQTCYPLFDIQGRMQDDQNLRPGIYIRNGNKVLIK